MLVRLQQLATPPRNHSLRYPLQTGLLLFLTFCYLAALSSHAQGRNHSDIAPQINSPSVVGVRPYHSFLYKTSATGARPLRFSARYLPRGLKLNSDTAIISGRVPNPGTHSVRLYARNSEQTVSQPFRINRGPQML